MKKEEKNFGKWIVRLRQGSGITQRQLGHFIGVSDKVISKWERGASEPDIDGLRALSSFFGMSVDDLLAGRLRETEKDKEEEPFSILPDSLSKKEIRSEREKQMNLIPPASDRFFGDYFCSWDAQQQTAKALGLVGTWCSEWRDTLTSGLVFGASSLFHPLPREYRKGMLFLLDDGWDVPLGTRADPASKKLFGTLLPDAEKFGDFGKTPQTRLENLSEMVKSLGYAGLGIWVAAEQGGESAERTHAFYQAAAKMHAAAGIRYWKVDWGDYAESSEYRRILSEEVHKNAPGLLVDHCVTQRPLAGIHRDADFLHRRKEETAKRMAFADVFRPYDVVHPFHEVTTLGQIDEAFSSPLPKGHDPKVSAGAEGYIAAVLGCTLGIMKVTDALYAALRFRRLSPPFGAAECAYFHSGERLTDTLYCENSLRSWVPTAGMEISESAPAIMSRGVPLPGVRPIGSIAPFVAASRHPETGVYAVGVFRRNIDPNLRIIAPADVTLSVSGEDVSVGVFGIYASLTLLFDAPLPKDLLVLAQDLLSEESFDVTASVTRGKNTLTFSGRDLRTWGKSSQKIFDTRDPALLLRIFVGGQKEISSPSFASQENDKTNSKDRKGRNP